MTVRRVLVIVGALVLSAAGAAVTILFLFRLTLNDAAAWAQILGLFVSTALSIGSLVVALLSLASNRRSPRSYISQNNSGGTNLANTGVIGSSSNFPMGGLIEQRNLEGHNVANAGIIDQPLDSRPENS